MSARADNGGDGVWSLLHTLTRAANEAVDETELLTLAADRLAASVGADAHHIDWFEADDDGGGVATPDAVATEVANDQHRIAIPVPVDGDVVAVLTLDGVGRQEVVGDAGLIGEQLGFAVGRLRQRAALEQTMAELERTNRDLERFSSMASHDLREPVRRVIAFAELVLARAGDRLEDDERGYVEAILRGGRRMDRLTTDLLAYARAGANFRLVPVSLTLVVRDVLTELADLVADVGAACTVGEELPVVNGDPTGLRQLVRNLVGNALRYAGPDPRVEVDAAVGDDGWWLQVTDHGPGMDVDTVSELRQPFVRGADTSAQGTGIGLALCDRIAELHGGTLVIEPTPGGGTTVRLQIGTAS